VSRDHIRTRRGAAITAGALLGALVGDRLLRRNSPPGLGKIGRRNGYTYTYATRGPVRMLVSRSNHRS
jgi:hypothetical protein